LEERQRLAADLGDKNLMLLRNHGTLALGRTVAEAFMRMYLLEWSCTVQVRAMSMGRPLHHPTPEAIEVVSTGARSPQMAAFAGELLWPAMLRKLDRIDPSYKD
ncbi:MAG TPA: class II aldolase/adducin family protein, partial [Solirubrobacterales bacterium]|nr:class II aldolase/adducin family protein [Solirubrobacterales bacterium]